MAAKNTVAPPQPVDRSDETYSLIRQYLVSGDMTSIAARLNVSISAVSRVACGDAVSKRIWAELIKTATKRRSEKLAWTDYMKAS